MKTAEHDCSAVIVSIVGFFIATLFRNSRPEAESLDCSGNFRCVEVCAGTCYRIFFHFVYSYTR